MKNGLRGKLLLVTGALLLVCLVCLASGAFLARWVWNSGLVIKSVPDWRGYLKPAQTDTPAEASTASPNPTSTHTALVISARETSEESKTPPYSIRARWPYIEWGDDPRAGPFNQAVEKIVDDEIQAFKENVSNLPDDPTLGNISSSLQIDFTPTNYQDGILSVLMHISFYSAGAAHPGSYSRSINYDLPKGQMLTLGELFNPGTQYLETISKICIEDLKTRDTLTWEEGALSEPDNYQVWNVTPAGLQITFDEYQVAPYAAGPQTVVIPYEQLKQIILADGPLAALVASSGK